MRRADSLEKTLMLEKIEDRRRTGRQRMRSLDGVTDLMGMSLSKLQEMVKHSKPSVLQSMGLQGVGHDWAINNNNNRLFSIVAAPIYFPTSCMVVFPFLHTLSTAYYL